jgi:signal transduction histidine kinase
MRVLLDTLNEGTVSDEKGRAEYVELLSRENARLSRLADDFLTFGRLERGEGRFRSEAVPIRQVAEDAVEELGLAIEKAGAEVFCGIDPQLRVLGDADAVLTLMLNLIENSLKYGGENPKITLAAESTVRSIRIEVCDDGPGIPAELRKLVFRRWFRGDRRLDESASGVGLGLAICRQLARRMKGRIRAANPGPDGGARIVVTLPSAGVAEEISAEPEPGTQTPLLSDAHRADR